MIDSSTNVTVLIAKQRMWVEVVKALYEVSRKEKRIGFGSDTPLKYSLEYNKPLSSHYLSLI